MDKKIYLTFDMDWACDELMDFLYNLLEKHDARATVNITNEFRSMEKYRKNSKFVLGIHPNFNRIIDGMGGAERKETVLNQCKEIIPDAIVARSHSLFSSSPLTKLLYDNGIRYELNCFIEPHEGICVYPWFFQEVLQVPFFYEDDLYLLGNSKRTPQFYLSENIKMYKVFNFHPIHLFLNSESLERYERIRENYHDFAILKENRNTDSYGILDFFEELIGFAQKEGYQFDTMTEMKGRT